MTIFIPRSTYIWLHFQVKLNAQGIDLLEKTLIYDPVHRISAKKILEHSYFDGFDKKYVPAVWTPVRQLTCNLVSV